MSYLRPKTHPVYDDYTITKEVLGLGISGKVWTCFNKQTNRKYAIKTLKDTSKARREIDLQWRASQNCPFIVQIVDVYENTVQNNKLLLVIMECMEGGELFGKISNRSKPFTEKEVAKIMHDICSAVKHLHDLGIAHRDLKPENLLLNTNDLNQEAIVKLTDFGFAKEVSLGLQTPCYTPYYVSPEVLGSDKYDASCDIWSLGVIMYILICGYPPFYSHHGKPISPGMKKRIRAGEYRFPEDEWKNVSLDAKTLIIGMLETDPKKRLKIRDIMRSNWISQYIDVPSTPLPSIEILKEDIDQWNDIRNEMDVALSEMRVNWDSNVPIRNINDVKENALLERRKNRVANLEPIKSMISQQFSDSKTPMNQSRSGSPTP
jgi:mitogen-activated protein kinase-activated protein kinase 2